MKLKKLFFLLFFQLILTSFHAQEANISNAIRLISTTKEFIAGAKIILEFKVEKETKFQLYCSNSYGSSIIESENSGNKISFEIPEFLTKKRGVLSWEVLATKEKVSGNITILSIQKPVTIETYLGPPSIDAGAVDYTMLVVIPTDSLDNPIRDNSKVLVKHQFLKSEKETAIYTDKLIGYKNIFSPLKSGRIIISSESFGLNSKEFDVNVMPAIATNFKLFVNRNHEYADGNQITTFYTSVIKDKNNNIVSDGSFVEFFIRNKTKNILKTFGTTINGIAKAKMIHPDYEEKWKVKAYFIGIAESNVLEVNYKKVIEDYMVSFSENNRKIKVGPLKSFMNQTIPDGLSVKLAIYQNNILIKQLYEESKNGFTEFYLDPNIFENNSYKIITETAGIQKEFKEIKL
ncbi:hypothetical protein [Polaribacter sp. IC073]|uniref:hypothetical protein n=1 Tax=Polaribacter sp. IC073 TaxID=2508540 RepID=UPI0011BE6C10|nr:hypothetical protein [Polaribacter sp. IC073]TXD49175.1 hypothetical protein ES045_03670 [Polaribacter sp. IC073]